MNPIARREFLRLLATGTGGLVITGLVGGCDTNVVESLGLLSTDFLTPVGDGPADFFFKNGSFASTNPSLTKASWQLEIVGGTAGTRTYTFQDLLDRAQSREISYLKTMQCIYWDPNKPRVANAYWTGLPLKVLLDEVGVPTAAKRVRMTAYDNSPTRFGSHATNLPVARVMAPTARQLPVMLAYGMNGVDLPVKHGFPVRVIVSEKFGYKNIKWLKRIELSTRDEPFGYYEGSAELGVEGFASDTVDMEGVSESLSPRKGQEVAGPGVMLSGFAVSGMKAIRKVEVSVDNGPFQPAAFRNIDDALARLAALGVLEPFTERGLTYPLPGVWVIWEANLTLAPGRHTVRMRATDEAGVVQPEEKPDVYPEEGDQSIRSVTFTVI